MEVTTDDSTHSHSLQVTVLTKPADTLRILKTIGAWADSLSFSYAWISSNRGKAEHWRALPLKKLEHGVVGLHFAQTEPWALRKLVAKGCGVIEGTAGVFHPKVLIGERSGQARAIVGSSNLTTGAYSANAELNLFLCGSAKHPVFVDLRNYIVERKSDDRYRDSCPQWWLARYEDAYKSRPRPPKMSKTSLTFEKEVNGSIGYLAWSWTEYYKQVLGVAKGSGLQIHHRKDGHSYLDELDECRAAFETEKKFEALDEGSRALIAGWSRKGSEKQASGYLGHNGGAGYFKHRVLKNARAIGKYLDRIPRQGPIPDDLSRACVGGLLDLKGLGLPCVTRLLTAKRPDWYLVVNKAVRPRMRRALGVFPNSAEAYVDLIASLRQTEWFRAPRPASQKQADVWSARMALLDVFFYKG